MTYGALAVSSDFGKVCNFLWRWVFSIDLLNAVLIFTLYNSFFYFIILAINFFSQSVSEAEVDSWEEAKKIFPMTGSTFSLV
jgi:hypothetical protein